MVHAPFILPAHRLCCLTQAHPRSILLCDKPIFTKTTQEKNRGFHRVCKGHSWEISTISKNGYGGTQYFDVTYPQKTGYFSKKINNNLSYMRHVFLPSFIRFILATSLVFVLACGDSGKSPEPEPPDIDNGNNDISQYLGSSNKNANAVKLVAARVGGDVTKALFGSTFWAKATWARYPSSNNLVEGDHEGVASQPFHFLNDDVVKDLLATKPEDWEKRQLSSGAIWVYTVKDQAAFTVKSQSQTHRVWQWIVAEGWTRPQGFTGPVVGILLANTSNLRDARSVCAWYEFNE
jgi:hypothetical protein